MNSVLWKHQLLTWKISPTIPRKLANRPLRSEYAIAEEIEINYLETSGFSLENQYSLNFPWKLANRSYGSVSINAEWKWLTTLNLK